jgi:hypothetical protein
MHYFALHARIIDVRRKATQPLNFASQFAEEQWVSLLPNVPIQLPLRNPKSQIQMIDFYFSS